MVSILSVFRYQWNEWELRREALAVAAEGEKRSEAVPCVDWHSHIHANAKAANMKKTAGKSGTQVRGRVRECRLERAGARGLAALR